MPSFTVRPLGALLEISDGSETVTTSAPAAIVHKTIAGAREDWRACDVAGFAERRARRSRTVYTRDPRTLAPAVQPDLFAQPL